MMTDLIFHWCRVSHPHSIHVASSREFETVLDLSDLKAGLYYKKGRLNKVISNQRVNSLNQLVDGGPSVIAQHFRLQVICSPLQPRHFKIKNYGLSIASIQRCIKWKKVSRFFSRRNNQNTSNGSFCRQLLHVGVRIQCIWYWERITKNDHVRH